jgi:hypothetical protein
MGCHIKRGFGVSSYLVADKLNVRPRGGKWGRRFGVRVRCAVALRFAACVRCEGGKTLVDGEWGLGYFGRGEIGKKASYRVKPGFD